MRINLQASVSQWLSDSEELDAEVERLETTAQQRRKARTWSE